MNTMLKQFKYQCALCAQTTDGASDEPWAERCPRTTGVFCGYCDPFERLCHHHHFRWQGGSTSREDQVQRIAETDDMQGMLEGRSLRPGETYAGLQAIIAWEDDKAREEERAQADRYRL